MSSTSLNGVSEFLKRNLAWVLAALLFSMSGIVPFPAQAEEESDEVYMFGTFEVHKAKVKIHRQAYKDRFEIKGWGLLGPDNNGVDIFNEDVTVTLGDFSQTIPAGLFFQTAESFMFVNGSHRGIQKLRFKFDGRFDIKVRGINLGEIGLDAPVIFSLQIGDDMGIAELFFDRRGKFRGQVIHDDDDDDDDDEDEDDEDDEDDDE